MFYVSPDLQLLLMCFISCQLAGNLSQIYELSQATYELQGPYCHVILGGLTILAQPENPPMNINCTF